MTNVQELVATAKSLKVPDLAQKANEIEIVQDSYKNAITAAKSSMSIVTGAFKEFEAEELSYQGFQTALKAMNSQLTVVQEHFNKLTQTQVELVFEVAKHLPTS